MKLKTSFSKFSFLLLARMVLTLITYYALGTFLSIGISLLNKSDDIVAYGGFGLSVLTLVSMCLFTAYQVISYRDFLHKHIEKVNDAAH